MTTKITKDEDLMNVWPTVRRSVKVKRKRNTPEQIGWAEIELSRVLDSITPAKAIEIIRKLAKGGK